MSAIVLGIGNILLQDEGIGVRAVLELERRFQQPEGVEFLDGGTAGIELLRHIRNRDLLIILDAVQSGKEPGTVVRAEGDEVPATFRQRMTPHQLGLSDLLATALLTGEMPKQLILFGIEPGSMETGLELTDKVAGSLDRLLELILNELKTHGYNPTPIAKNEMEAPSIWAMG